MGAAAQVLQGRQLGEGVVEYLSVVIASGAGSRLGVAVQSVAVSPQRGKQRG